MLKTELMRSDSLELAHVKLPDGLSKGLNELEDVTGIEKNTLLEIALKIGLAVLLRETGTNSKPP